MTSNHEVQVDGLVQTCEHSAHEVLHHGVILVLVTAVVRVQTGGGLAKSIMAEKEVQKTDNCVRLLACITGLIVLCVVCKEHTPKMATFLGVKK